MSEKICPLMAIWQAVIESNTNARVSATCIKEQCEFWAKQKNHYKQKEQYGCAVVLSVHQKIA